jgi:uncharacterized protein with PQ loop repeat
VKEIIGGIAALLTVFSYIAYYRDILRGATRPHTYSWTLWGLLTTLLVALQIKGGAGPGAWITITAGLLCFGVVFLSIKHGNRDITWSDKIVAVLSLIAMGLWLGVNQPVVALVFAIIADLLAFVPTVRKSWNKPETETLSFYVTNTFRFTLGLAALDSFTFLSSAWQIVWLVGNALFAAMLVYRRKILARK